MQIVKLWSHINFVCYLSTSHISSLLYAVFVSQSLSSAQAQAEALELALLDATSRLAEARDAHTARTEASAAAHRTAQRAIAERRKAEGELETAQSGARALVAAAAGDVTVLEGHVRSGFEAIVEMRKRKFDTIKTLKDIRERTRDAETAVSALQEQKTASLAARDTAAVRFAAVDAELAAQEKELAVAVGKLATLQSETASHTAASEALLDSIREEASSMALQRSEIQREIADLRARNDALAKQTSHLRRGLAAKRQDNIAETAALEHQRATAAAELHALENANAADGAAVARDADELTATLASLRAAVAAAEADHAAATAAANAARATAADGSATEAELAVAVAAAEASARLWRAETLRRRRGTTGMTAELRTVTSLSARLTAEQRELHSALRELAVQLAAVEVAAWRGGMHKGQKAVQASAATVSRGVQTEEVKPPAGAGLTGKLTVPSPAPSGSSVGGHSTLDDLAAEGLGVGVRGAGVTGAAAVRVASARDSSADSAEQRRKRNSVVSAAAKAKARASGARARGSVSASIGDADGESMLLDALPAPDSELDTNSDEGDSVSAGSDADSRSRSPHVGIITPSAHAAAAASRAQDLSLSDGMLNALNTVPSLLSRLDDVDAYLAAFEAAYPASLTQGDKNLLAALRARAGSLSTAPSDVAASGAGAGSPPGSPLGTAVAGQHLALGTLLPQYGTVGKAGTSAIDARAQLLALIDKARSDATKAATVAAAAAANAAAAAAAAAEEDSRAEGKGDSAAVATNGKGGAKGSLARQPRPLRQQSQQLVGVVGIDMPTVADSTPDDVASQTSLATALGSAAASGRFDRGDVKSSKGGSRLPTVTAGELDDEHYYTGPASPMVPLRPTVTGINALTQLAHTGSEAGLGDNESGRGGRRYLGRGGKGASAHSSDKNADAVAGDQQPSGDDDDSDYFNTDDDDYGEYDSTADSQSRSQSQAQSRSHSRSGHRGRGHGRGRGATRMTMGTDAELLVPTGTTRGFVRGTVTAAKAAAAASVAASAAVSVADDNGYTDADADAEMKLLMSNFASNNNAAAVSAVTGSGGGASQSDANAVAPGVASTPGVGGAELIPYWALESTGHKDPRAWALPPSTRAADVFAAAAAHASLHDSTPRAHGRTGAGAGPAAHGRGHGGGAGDDDGLELALKQYLLNDDNAAAAWHDAFASVNSNDSSDGVKSSGAPRSGSGGGGGGGDGDGGDSELLRGIVSQAFATMRSRRSRTSADGSGGSLSPAGAGSDAGGGGSVTRSAFGMGASVGVRREDSAMNRFGFESVRSPSQTGGSNGASGRRGYGNASPRHAGQRGQSAAADAAAAREAAEEAEAAAVEAAAVAMGALSPGLRRAAAAAVGISLPGSGGNRGRVGSSLDAGGLSVFDPRVLSNNNAMGAMGGRGGTGGAHGHLGHGHGQEFSFDEDATAATDQYSMSPTKQQQQGQRGRWGSSPVRGSGRNNTRSSSGSKAQSPRMQLLTGPRVKLNTDQQQQGAGAGAVALLAPPPRDRPSFAYYDDDDVDDEYNDDGNGYYNYNNDSNNNNAQQQQQQFGVGAVNDDVDEDGEERELVVVQHDHGVVAAVDTYKYSDAPLFALNNTNNAAALLLPPSPPPYNATYAAAAVGSVVSRAQSPTQSLSHAQLQQLHLQQQLQQQYSYSQLHLQLPAASRPQSPRASASTATAQQLSRDLRWADELLTQHAALAAGAAAEAAEAARARSASRRHRVRATARLNNAGNSHNSVGDDASVSDATATDIAPMGVSARGRDLKGEDEALLQQLRSRYQHSTNSFPLDDGSLSTPSHGLSRLPGSGLFASPATAIAMASSSASASALGGARLASSRAHLSTPLDDKLIIGDRLLPRDGNQQLLALLHRSEQRLRLQQAQTRARVRVGRERAQLAADAAAAAAAAAALGRGAAGLASHVSTAAAAGDALPDGRRRK